MCYSEDRQSIINLLMTLLIYSLYDFENASLAFDDTDQGALDIVVQPDGLCSAFANQTTTQTLHVRCLKPFMHPIVALLTFSVGGHSHELSLTLPLTLGTFILPVRMEAKQFVLAWLKYSIECIGVRRLAQLLELKDFERIVVVSLNMTIINYVENVLATLSQPVHFKLARLIL